MKKEKDVLQTLQEKLDKGKDLTKQEQLFMINNTRETINAMHKLLKNK